MDDIKSMGLYRNVERIEADLAAAGFGPGDAVSVHDLTPFDQYHYEGTDAVDDACRFLSPDPSTRIVDIGSGLGGPARYIADRTGSQVTALELQADLHTAAQALTARAGLDHLVHHINGDVLKGAVRPETFNGIVSMLCFLHIPDRSTLFSECARALKPDGRIFIDDYYQRSPFTERETADLAQKVYCPYVPTLDTYVTDLQQAGFTNIEVIDKTSDWTTFVTDRLARFRSITDELDDRYGHETVASLDDFYSTVANLFTKGHLGGARITATHRSPTGPT